VDVQFNARLLKKKAKRKEKKDLYADNCDYAQGWIVEGGDDEEVDPISGISYEVLSTAMGVDEIFMPRRSGRNVQPRELDEDDFVSEDEEVDEELELESDDEVEIVNVEGDGQEEEWADD